MTISISSTAISSSELNPLSQVGGTESPKTVPGPQKAVKDAEPLLTIPDLPPQDKSFPKDDVTDLQHGLPKSGVAQGPTINQGLKPIQSEIEDIGKIDIPLEQIVPLPEKNETTADKLQTFLHTLSCGEGQSLDTLEQLLDIVQSMREYIAQRSAEMASRKKKYGADDIAADRAKFIQTALQSMTPDQRQGLLKALVSPEFNSLRVSLGELKTKWDFERVEKIEKKYTTSVSALLINVNSIINMCYAELYDILQTTDKKTPEDLESLYKLSNNYMISPEFIKAAPSSDEIISTFEKTMLGGIKEKIMADISDLKAVVTNVPLDFTVLATTLVSTSTKAKDKIDCEFADFVRMVFENIDLERMPADQLTALNSAFLNLHNGSELKAVKTAVDKLDVLLKNKAPDPAVLAESAKMLHEMAKNGLLFTVNPETVEMLKSLDCTNADEIKYLLTFQTIKTIYDNLIPLKMRITMTNELVLRKSAEVMMMRALKANPVESQGISTALDTIKTFYGSDYQGQLGLANWLKTVIGDTTLTSTAQASLLDLLPEIAQRQVGRFSQFKEQFGKKYGIETLNVMTANMYDVTNDLPVYGKLDNFLRGLKNIFVRIFSVFTGSEAHTLMEEELISRAKEYGARHLFTMSSLLANKIWTAESMESAIVQMLSSRDQFTVDETRQYAKSIATTLFNQCVDYTKTEDGQAVLQSERMGHIVNYVGTPVDADSAALNFLHSLGTGLADADEFAAALDNLIDFCPPDQLGEVFKQMVKKSTAKQKNQLKAMLSKPEVQKKLSRFVGQSKAMPKDIKERGSFLRAMLPKKNIGRYLFCNDDIASCFYKRADYILSAYNTLTAELAIPVTPLADDPVSISGDDIELAFGHILPAKHDGIIGLITTLSKAKSFDDELWAMLKQLMPNSLSIYNTYDFIVYEFIKNPSEIAKEDTDEVLAKAINVTLAEQDKRISDDDLYTQFMISELWRSLIILRKCNQKKRSD